MLEDLMRFLNTEVPNSEGLRKCLVEREFQPRAVLLREGNVSNCIFFIKKGCLRLCFNNDGKDVTLQFFMEGQAVASIDSFLNNKPSRFSIECIETSTVVCMSKRDFDQLKKNNPEIEKGFQQLLFKRFGNYVDLFLSRIKDSPRERYEDLIRKHPELLKRIPQHYIASYLGITSISLSRIRNRR